MTTVPLTVLVHEGPAARAYLALMRSAGLRPARIIQMVLERDGSTGAAVAPWLPSPWRARYAAWVQDRRHNFWPRRLRRTYPLLYQGMRITISTALGAPAAVLDEMHERADYRAYADDVVPVLVHGLADPRLEELLRAMPETAVLFTGGGILPKRLLDMPGLRFIHVHPAALPDIRGADGLLWSVLIKKQTGASCFYMAPGIDTGDIIAVRTHPPLAFALMPTEAPDWLHLYRAVFSYYDPLLRADLLLRVLRSGGDPARLPSRAQDLRAGDTYRFLNPHLRRRSLARLFPGLREPAPADD